jgi:hypothetical protein
MTEKTHASLAIPARETDQGHALPPRHREWRRAQIAIVIVLVLLLIGAIRTVVARILNDHAVQAATTQNAKQYVNVDFPKQADGAGDTLLPGT